MAPALRRSSVIMTDKMVNEIMDIETEKRQHRRLELRLPLEYRRRNSHRSMPTKTLSLNVSTSGIYFETTAEDIRVGETLELELGIPENDNRFPSHGYIVTTGNVIRIVSMKDTPNTEGAVFTRYGIAASFSKGFKLAF